MGERIVLRSTWSNLLAGTVVWLLTALASALMAQYVFDGFLGAVSWLVAIVMAGRVLLRWSTKSLVVTPTKVVYRRDLRRVQVPVDGVAAFSVRPVPFGRKRGTGVAIHPDRPLATLPVPLVPASDAERFEQFAMQHWPEIPVNPAGTWQDRFGRWHVEEDGVDVYGILQIGLRPLEVGDAKISVETDDAGSRAVRRHAASGIVEAEGAVHAERRHAVADAVDMYRLVRSEPA